MTTIIETIPLAATDTEIAAAWHDLAAFYSDAQEQGLDPTILFVESHPGGDSVAIELDA